MKLYNKIVLTLGAAAIMTSCTDMLDTKPQGSTFTSEQQKELAELDPSLLSADIAAMYSQMYAPFAAMPASEIHADFGVPGVAIALEGMGADVPCEDTGYNWYSQYYTYEAHVYTYWGTRMVWDTYYKIIRAANAVLTTTGDAPEDAQLKAYRGEALTLRAYAYFTLAQAYQFTYVGSQDKLCVPIITAKTTAEEANENPRATVSEVYKLISEGLDEAITLLEGYSAPSKGSINQAVAYGVRARVNLVKEEWTAAADDAAKALELSGATPYTLAEVSKPTFNSATANSVMWAIMVNEELGAVKTGIVNWPSMYCSFTGNGYVGVGPFKAINVNLWNDIKSTDVRKGWWLDATKSSPLVTGAEYKDWRDAYESQKFFVPYSNVKFGAYKDEPMNATNAQDFILMRAEEMILVQAEGLAMGGKTAEAKALLEGFVKANRDAAYACPASDAAGLQEEILFQRRVELWGEGFSFFDLKRLKKDVVRHENGVSNFPANFIFNVKADDDVMLLRVPQAEISANKGITEEDNNVSSTLPTPEAI